MRKPLFLAVLGVSIAVSAVAVGIALTRYLSLRAYSPKASTAAATPEESGTPPSPVEDWQNPFSPSQGMKVPSRLPSAAGKGTLPVSRTNFVLVGTIVSTIPSARRAILWAEGMKEPRAYKETEEVEPGTVLASVERDRAWLARGSEREKLELLPVGSRARGPAPPPGAPRPVAAQVVPVPAPPPPNAPPTAIGSVENAEGEGPGRVTGRTRRPEPAPPPPVVSATPGMGQAGGDEDEGPRRKRRPARGRQGR